MLELQHGHVVCINSILSQSAIPGAIDYCTSKASSLAFMESLALGLLDCPGVGCTTVLPFHTNTEMFQGMRVRYLCIYIHICYLFIAKMEGMAIHVPHRMNHKDSGDLSLCATLKFIVQREHFINYWMDFWELCFMFPRSLKDTFYYYYLFIQPQQFSLKSKLDFYLLVGYIWFPDNVSDEL